VHRILDPARHSAVASVVWCLPLPKRQLRRRLQDGHGRHVPEADRPARLGFSTTVATPVATAATVATSVTNFATVATSTTNVATVATSTTNVATGDV
jgi:hypothetical protein